MAAERLSMRRVREILRYRETGNFFGVEYGLLVRPEQPISIVLFGDKARDR
jgi:hypothetical protein